jgi:uncharacterized protein with PQ loop repeat
MIELIMITVGFSYSVAYIPQLIKLHKRKTSDDISISMWIISFHANCWFMWYGFNIHSLSLIITNILSNIIGILTIFTIIKYRYFKKKGIQ